MRKCMQVLLASVLIMQCPFTYAGPWDWTSGFRGTGPSADDVTTDTTNFNTNLTTADDNVQKSLDTLDELVSGSTLTVQEEDGLPTGTPSTLKFTNGKVTDNGDGSFSISVTGTGGSSEFTDLGTILHPNETTDDLALGNTTLVNASKLSIDGDADQVQLTVQGFSTQTDSLIIAESSAGTEVATIDVSGLLTTAIGVDAIGAVDMDYGSVDVTDHTFLTDGTGTGEIVLPAGSIDGTEILDGTVDLTSDITGNLPVANLDSGTGASSSTFWSGFGSWELPLTSSNANTIGNGFIQDQSLTFDGSGASDGKFVWSPTLLSFRFEHRLEFLSGVELELPNGLTPTVPSEAGEVAVDTNQFTGQGELQIHDGTQIQHIVGTTDTPADNEIPKFDSGTGTITWEADVGGAQLTQEQVEDFSGSMVANVTGTHTHVTVTYQDATGDMDFVVDDALSAYTDDLIHTVDTNTQLSQEQVEDFSGALITDGTGTHTRVTITYQDVTGDVDIIVDDMNDDIPEAGDFGNATDLDANGAIVANGVALATDTTGDYVTAITAGTNITSTGATTGENISHTLSVDDAFILNTGDVGTGTFDLGGASLEIPNGTTLPVTCNVGDQFMDTDATSGQRYFLCESVNTWVLQGDGGGSETNNLETQDPPNVLINEIYIGTGAGAGAWITSSGDVTNSLGVFTVSANAVTLSTDTTGNYVGTVAAGTGITIAEADGEGVTKTVVATLGTAIDAGEISAAAIDGDDVNGNIAGRSITLTVGAPDVLDADAELFTDQKTLWFEDPAAVDDFKTIWVAPIPTTISSISCESDQTVTFDLQIDDGTPAGVNGSDITCTTFATDSVLAGDVTMAAGDRLDLAITSVSGTPTFVSISWEITYDD